MAAQEIKHHALDLFMERGYEGASLTDIGNRVGIKKQSIYFHYKNKDDLFLQIMREVVKSETLALNQYFSECGNNSLHQILFNFVVYLKDRYTTSDERGIKFMLTMMFSPPHHIRETVKSYALIYYRRLEEVIFEIFKENEDVLRVSIEEGTTSFMNLIDGLLVELIYIDKESFEKRFYTCWDIYWHGIKA